MRNIRFYIFIVSLKGALLSISPACAQDQPETLIRISTNYGDMIALLYNDTPLHRDNMLKLISNGFYNNLIFHRVIEDFMIQGGDPHSVGADKGQRLGTGGPGYTIPAEILTHHFHKKGALAAARKGDQVNPEKASSGSQFYIVQGRIFTSAELDLLTRQRNIIMNSEAESFYTSIGGTPHLDGGYTVFGELVEGYEVLDKIASLPTDAYNRPLSDVVFRISIEP